MRTRARNNGGAQGFVGLTVTLFLIESVVAVGSALVSDWYAADTQTVTYISTDDYAGWDAFEFQVDSEF